MDRHADRRTDKFRSFGVIKGGPVLTLSPPFVICGHLYHLDKGNSLDWKILINALHVTPTHSCCLKGHGFFFRFQFYAEDTQQKSPGMLILSIMFCVNFFCSVTSFKLNLHKGPL